MNLKGRKKCSRMVEIANRKFEKVFYPKLQKAINKDISSLIDYLKINGLDSAPKYFDDNIASKSLTEIVHIYIQRLAFIMPIGFIGIR